MNTRHIQTTGEQIACDVCGRTLLRGERAETYVAGGSRRSVCELCTTRALHEGWVREGTLPDMTSAEGAGDRRRSLLSRLRARREALPVETPRRARAVRADRPQPDRGASGGERSRGTVPDPVREPRHVRAVPTSAEHKVAAAVETFNGSEHCRTVAGVARSLGAPEIAVRPSGQRQSAVEITVCWELCWYRYEVDLGDEVPSVRLAGQGYELSELTDRDRETNATADERGAVVLT